MEEKQELTPEQKKLAEQHVAKMTAINGSIMEVIDENRREIIARAAKKLRDAGYSVTEEELEIK